MEIFLFSIVAGGRACNARCPFCVSKMTPPADVPLKEPQVKWDMFYRACEYIKNCGTKNVMITSKGEATIWPNQISRFLDIMKQFHFKFIELQTNGILLDEKFADYGSHLNGWKESGLGLIAISVVHYNPEKNKQIYVPYKQSYIDLERLIFRLRALNFRVRLSCIMVKDFIDDPDDIASLISFVRANHVDELTVRPVNKPKESESPEVYRWTSDNQLSREQLIAIDSYFSKIGTLKNRTHFGARIFDVSGQNVCLTNSLTHDENPELIRQAIFFPEGILTTSWEDPEGGRLL